MAQEQCRGRSSGTRGTQQTRLVFHALVGCPRLTAPRAARLATFKPTPNTGLPAVTPRIPRHVPVVLRTGFAGEAFYNTATPQFSFLLKSCCWRYTPW